MFYSMSVSRDHRISLNIARPNYGNENCYVLQCTYIGTLTTNTADQDVMSG